MPVDKLLMAGGLLLCTVHHSILPRLLVFKGPTCSDDGALLEPSIGDTRSAIHGGVQGGGRTLGNQMEEVEEVI